MKLFVTGTRGIPDIMGGVETHCEELFPRIAERGVDVTLARRRNYVHDSLKAWKGVKLLDIDSPKKKSFEAIIHTFRAVLAAKKMKAEFESLKNITLLEPVVTIKSAYKEADKAQLTALVDSLLAE